MADVTPTAGETGEPVVPRAEPPVLESPAGGIPEVTASDDGLAAVAAALRAGTGPVAVDAERASGHRYGQRAFLVQLRRAGSGTFLVDPVAVPQLEPLAMCLNGPEWILHSATQDLPCLAELGLRPAALFDTELAGRLLGLPHVGLAGLTEDLLGVRLAKGFGAADWSKRPLPPRWLAYAALDVELLSDLRAELADRLVAAGRMPWAEQEFAALLSWRPKVRLDPWRRTSGVQRINEPRGLAVVRELWLSREDLARTVDRPPSRVLPDAAIVAAARARPRSQTALAQLPEFARQRRSLGRWWRSVERAGRLPDADLPRRTALDGPPPPRSWERRNPVAAARLAAVRAAVAERAESLGITAEVLVAPDIVRGLVWDAPVEPPSPADVDDSLAEAGARPWQREHVVPVIAGALRDAG